jgi:hypothetical protein
MIPQKQRTLQFIGSFKKGCNVSVISWGANVAIGVNVKVGVMVEVTDFIVGDKSSDLWVGCFVPPVTQPLRIIINDEKSAR